MKLELMNKRKYYRTIVAGDDAEEVRVDWDEYEYKCPCGKGKVVESIDETPGDREHEIWILCKECQKVYMIDITNGKNNWKIVKKEDNRILMGKEINERDKAWNEFLYKCTLSEYLSQSRFKMRLQRSERDKTGKAEITRDRANLTRTILRVCDSNNEKNGQNFISVFAVMKNKRIIG